MLPVSTCAMAAAEASHDFRNKIGPIGNTGVAGVPPPSHSDLSRLIARGLHRGADQTKNCRNWIPDANLIGVKEDIDMMAKIFQAGDTIKHILLDDVPVGRGGTWKQTSLLVSRPNLHVPATRQARYIFIPRYLNHDGTCPINAGELATAQATGLDYTDLSKIFAHTFNPNIADATGGDKNNQVFVMLDQAQEVFAAKHNNRLIDRLQDPQVSQLHINIVFSSASFSDPGQQASPNSKVWNEKLVGAKACPMTTWVYSDEAVPAAIQVNGGTGVISKTTVPFGDPMGLSLYTIETSVNQKFIADQIWTNSDTGAPTHYINTSKTTTIGAVADKFDKTTDDDVKSRELQTKRIGDYFQIRDAKNLPDNAIKHNAKFISVNKNGYTFPEPPPQLQHPAGSLQYIKQLFNKAKNWVSYVFGTPPPTAAVAVAVNADKEWYRKRTFLFTGDWMAFLWAAHNEVNCVYVCKTPPHHGFNSQPQQGLACIYFD